VESGKRHRVAVIAVEGGPLFELAVPCAVFGSPAASAYTLQVCGERSSVASSAALRLAAPHGLEAAHGADTIVVPTWARPGEEPSPELLQLLREEHARGARIVGLCLGAFVVASAGLLDGRTATTHWAFADLFVSLHPRVALVAGDVFVDHGDVVTAAGSASGLDCCVHLVRRDAGAAVAAAVARELVLAPQRAGTATQLVSPAAPPADLAETMSWALAHLHEDIDADALASHACVSRRTLERLFRRATGSGPAAWLAAQRVLAAQELLETSALTVGEIAARTGFGTAGALRRRFLAQVGRTPTAHRRALAG
jgi:transcriptional regulator GlxA family with amidase domain